MAVDCGHGDRDPGFVIGSVQEKDINLQVGLKTAQVLKEKGYNVFLTRDKDTYLALDARTTKVNAKPHIDLFISLHANASKDTKISGIETFCVQPSLFTSQFSKSHASERDAYHEYVRSVHAKSKKLADAVQQGLLAHARKHNNKVVDRKVKYSPAQVLMGLEVPAVLVELGFLSHTRERALLQSSVYQNALAVGICKGIENFLQRTFA